MNRAAPAAMLVLIGAIWALTFPLTRMAVLGGYRNFGIIFWSTLIGAIGTGILLLLARRSLPLHRAALLRYLFVALFGTVLPSASTYTAAEHIPAGVIAICMTLAPMASLPMAVLLGIDHATVPRMLGLVLGLIGALLIVVPDASLPDGTASMFVLLAFLGAVFYAIEGVGIGFWGGGGLGPVQLLCGASLIGAVFALVLALAFGSFRMPAAAAADAAVLVSGLANLAAYVGYVWLIGQAGAVFAAQVAYVVTILGVVWSMILLGEGYSGWIWGALAFMLAGLALVSPRPARSENAQSTGGVDLLAADQTEK